MDRQNLIKRPEKGREEKEEGGGKHMARTGEGCFVSQDEISSQKTKTTP